MSQCDHKVLRRGSIDLATAGFYACEDCSMLFEIPEPIIGPVLGTCCHVGMGHWNKHEQELDCLNWRPLAGTEKP